MASCFRFIQ